MAYRVYIKNDYKPEVVCVRPGSRLRLIAVRAMLASCVLLIPVIGFSLFEGAEPADNNRRSGFLPPSTAAGAPEEPEPPEQSVLLHVDDTTAGLPRVFAPPFRDTASGASSDWLDVRVERGDNMARIFKRNNLSPRDLHDILDSHKLAAALKHLRPGQVISLQAEGGELRSLKPDVDLTHSWDIDYRLDIRKGDSFRIVYEEKFRIHSSYLFAPLDTSDSELLAQYDPKNSL